MVPLAETMSKKDSNIRKAMSRFDGHLQLCNPCDSRLQADKVLSKVPL